MRIMLMVIVYPGIVFNAFLAFEDSSPDAVEPTFLDTPGNITEIAGNTAVLRCKVDNLNDHAVVWTSPKETVLSQMIQKVIDDPRMGVEQEHSIQDWNLHIRNVKYGDKGIYKCIVNTDPPKIKYVFLDIQVPAQIDAATSSNDVTIREGQTVELICNASGVPQPLIQWYRVYDDHDRRQKEAIFDPGYMLIIHNISRDCDGTYICEAYNNVDVPVSREIEVTVVFPPEVRIRTARLGQYLGKETVLQCECIESPISICVWKKDGEEIETVSSKYRLYTYEDGPHTITLSLTIHKVTQEDFAKYVCFASNSYGEDSESMVLYEYRNPTTVSKKLQTTAPTTKAVIFNQKEKEDSSTKPHRINQNINNNLRTVGSYRKNTAVGLSDGNLLMILTVAIIRTIICNFYSFNRR